MTNAPCAYIMRNIINNMHNKGEISKMESFSIIQTMCRIGLGSNNPAFRKQVERLQKSLEEAGDVKAASALMRLLNAQDKVSSLHPS